MATPWKRKPTSPSISACPEIRVLTFFPLEPSDIGELEAAVRCSGGANLDPMGRVFVRKHRAPVDHKRRDEARSGDAGPNRGDGADFTQAGNRRNGDNGPDKNEHHSEGIATNHPLTM